LTLPVLDSLGAIHARATTITHILAEILAQRSIPHGGINE